MYHIDFQNPIFIHFIGIGGISMSGLAEILMEKGFTVSGSDAQKSDLTKHLETKGAVVYYGQQASNIKGGVDVVVYTAAVHPDNPEYGAAKEKALPMLTRAELLGQMMKNYRYAAGISGTHGKTTTTSMVAEILMAAGKDPTISVGGILNSIGGNIRVGGSDLFVTEACEYTNSFLSFFPNMEIILNIEEDHLDFFKDIEDIRRSFRLFAEKLPKDGVLVINSDIEWYEEITEGLECRVVTVGHKQDSDYSAGHITYDQYARAQETAPAALRTDFQKHRSKASPPVHATRPSAGLPLPSPSAPWLPGAPSSPCRIRAGFHTGPLPSHPGKLPSCSHCMPRWPESNGIAR